MEISTYGEMRNVFKTLVGNTCNIYERNFKKYGVRVNWIQLALNTERLVGS
jgi:hypothetical protein